MKKVLICVVLSLAAVPSAQASWRTPVDGTKSGYCARAYPGKPISYIWFKDVRHCPDNQRRKTPTAGTRLPR